MTQMKKIKLTDAEKLQAAGDLVQVLKDITEADNDYELEKKSSKAGYDDTIEGLMLDRLRLMMLVETGYREIDAQMTMEEQAARNFKKDMEKDGKTKVSVEDGGKTVVIE